MKKIKIAQGAEATIFSDKKTVIKHRFKKEYRHKEIDEQLRKSRTKREAKVIERLQLINFPGPKLHKFCDKEMTIDMEHIDGYKLRDILHENYVEFGKEIGRKIAKLHKHDIIHGDLTTSNMILKKKEGYIHFIDFGLSFFSTKHEDKAVDLHLLRRALESKHHKIWKECFEAVLEGYREHPEHEQIIKRLEHVEKRGRNKAK